MTGHNPNAFYELGYRQALGLPLVPIISKGDRLPFDVAGYRTVFYSLHVEEIEQSKNELKAMIQSFSNFKMKTEKEKLSEFEIINQKLDKLLEINSNKTPITNLDNLTKQRTSSLFTDNLDLDQVRKRVESTTLSLKTDSLNSPLGTIDLNRQYNPLNTKE